MLADARGSVTRHRVERGGRVERVSIDGSQRNAASDRQATDEGATVGAKPSEPSRPAQASGAQTNGRKAVDFVCEDDVRRAIQKDEKIYVGARTIITPAARDMGEAAEVFAKA